ncbi:hypothetical protein JOB18_047015 [Solea senegalensis]|uniref:Uncharacterized protein n=1 Tax=Solea senegalensis TaxID=28829 RepID=A0AAV6Q326_SOLSE|nr:hypothetical protein JOB18_047015 [Solea senegalensis]
MGLCCHGNNLPNPVSETFLNGNLSAVPALLFLLLLLLLHKSRFISDAPPLLSPCPGAFDRGWSSQRQHSPEVFKQIIKPAVKAAGKRLESNEQRDQKEGMGGGVVMILILTCFNMDGADAATRRESLDFLSSFTVFKPV